MAGTAAGAYVLARIVSAADPRWAPGIVVATAAGVAVLHTDTLLATPLRSPLGYANATAAFFVLASVGASMLALRAGNTVLAGTAWCLACAAAAVPWLNGSWASAFATVILTGALLLAVTARRVSHGRVILAGLALTLAVHATTVVLAVACAPAGQCVLPDRAAEAVTQNRLDLWADALNQLVAQPWTGVGPGRFAELSGTALNDADLQHAHGELLELAAELGLVGLTLGVALVVWLYVTLSREPRGPTALVAAAGLTGVLLQSAFDYVLHYPAVVAAAFALIAAGATSRRTPLPDIVP